MRKSILAQVEAPTLDMSSLIDVSFLLLIYFLATSTLDPKESDLGMTLPEIPKGSPIHQEVDPMEIEVDSEGRILVNREVIDSDANSRDVPVLLDRLATYADSARLIDTEPVVIISAADSSKGQRFVDVINALAHRRVAIRKVTVSGFID
ncbi:MAG: biopolymer transporter ExbD [Verrucomicrobiales bacterium]|nr:biopolymer transporter ExbD [Verrucomicrobiales bacterium]